MPKGVKRAPKRLKLFVIDALKWLLLLLGVRTVEKDGVFVIIRNPEDPDELVLVQHEKDENWSLPGGGQKQGETADVAGIREVLDETGLVVELHPIPIGHFALQKRYGSTMLLNGFVRSGSIRESGNDYDILACRYFNIHDLPPMYNAQRGLIGWAQYHRQLSTPVFLYGSPNHPPLKEYATP